MSESSPERSDGSEGSNSSDGLTELASEVQRIAANADAILESIRREEQQANLRKTSPKGADSVASGTRSSPARSKLSSFDEDDDDDDDDMLDEEQRLMEVSEQMRLINQDFHDPIEPESALQDKMKKDFANPRHRDQEARPRKPRLPNWNNSGKDRPSAIGLLVSPLKMVINWRLFGMFCIFWGYVTLLIDHSRCEDLTDEAEFLQLPWLIHS